MAKKNKPSRAANAVEQRLLPAVSVIIPMYNAEKYIGECLDSILAQTFQNFEVIVVDDCSTDSSYSIVESYAEKFGGRLKLTKLKKNSGGGGEPRNKGLEFSCGEYVFFMDSDDALTRTGLEDMYTLAKQFDADTIYCESYFMSSGKGQDFINNVHIADKRIQHIPPVDKPTLETNDMAERVKKAVTWQYWVTPWLRMVSRNLLVENDIKFPPLIGSNDVGWTFEVLFCSKRFLRIPTPCYIWRVHEESNTFRQRTPSNRIHKWMDRTVRGLKIIDDFMSSLEFFNKNPQYRYAVFDFFSREDFKQIFKVCIDASPNIVYETFKQEFGKYLGKQDVLVSYLCSLVNTQQKIFNLNQQQFNQFAAQAQKRTAELENEIKRLKGQA